MKGFYKSSSQTLLHKSSFLLSYQSQRYIRYLNAFHFTISSSINANTNNTNTSSIISDNKYQNHEKWKNIIKQKYFIREFHSGKFKDNNNNNDDNEKNDNKNHFLVRNLGAAGSALLIFSGKTKYIFAALKLTKLSTLSSMLLSSVAYGLVYGWSFGIGIVSLIFIHESGHALAMKYYGVKYSPMVFVPFLGAAVAMKSEPKSAYDEAMIALAGPVLGSIGAIICGYGGYVLNNELLYTLSYFGFMINLMNLIPIGSLDGGRIAGALSKWLLLAGLGIAGFSVYNGIINHPLWMLIFLAGGWTTFQRFYNPLDYTMYYAISSTQKFRIAFGYFGLIILLILALEYSRKKLKSPSQIVHEKQIKGENININEKYHDLFNATNYEENYNNNELEQFHKDEFFSSYNNNNNNNNKRNF